MCFNANVLVVVITYLLLLCDGSKSQGDVCGGTLTGRRGTLSSPDFPSHYPLNKLCIWILNTLESSRKIRLTFDTFDLEPEPVCKYDYVLIRDGTSATSRIIGKFCGANIPATITSSGRSLWVEFRSDSSDRRPGFFARWGTVYAIPHEAIKNENVFPSPKAPLECGGTIRGTRGTLSSPDFPEKYPNNKQCKWTIITPVGSKVRLDFKALNIENGRACRYDYLELRDGLDSDAPFIDKLCGVIYPSSVTSMGNSLYLELSTDDSVAESGFQIDWHALGLYTPTISTTQGTKTEKETTTTQMPTTPVSDNYRCGQTISGTAGVIKSPNYPSNYPENTMCSWIIQVAAEEQIELEFQTMDLEEGATCRYDYLEIKDGAVKSAALKNKLCGNTVPPLIKSSGSALYLEFYSDTSVTRTGFYAIWRAVDLPGLVETTDLPQPKYTTSAVSQSQGCDRKYSSLTGTIKSPGHPSNYPSNTVCKWTIQVPQIYTIRLEFSKFDLEDDPNCRFDYLTIYDGYSVASPEMAKICGNERTSIIPTIDSSSNALTIVFNSDTSTTAQGFEAFWSVYVNGRIPTTKAPQPQSVAPSTKPVTPSSECGGTSIQSRGDIYSPGYPYSYRNNVDCIWVVGVPNNKIIAIGFEEFHLEGGDDCEFDFVELRDGQSRYSPLIGRYCGNTAPLMIKATSDRLWVRFHSNGLVTGKGFEATWIAERRDHIRTQGADRDIPQRVNSYPIPLRKCGRALGIESKDIKDSQLEASSSWMSANKYGPQQARLNNRIWPQGWIASSNDKDPWIKTTFSSMHIITDIATQGYGNTLFNEWVKSYIVSWFDPKHNGYINYREQGIDKIFNGNTDRDSIVRHNLKTPIHTKKIILKPKTWQRNVGMRFELYGCPVDECSQPLGLSNGAIQDAQLKSSSVWNNEQSKFGAHYARLGHSPISQGWKSAENDQLPWLEIVLKKNSIVTKVATEGHDGSLNNWVKLYKLTWLDDNQKWVDYYVPRTVGQSEWRTKVFHASSDQGSITQHILKVPIRTKAIRIWPQEKGKTMRAELYGCLTEVQNGDTHCERKGNSLLGESHVNSLKNCEWLLTSQSTQGNFLINFETFSFDKSDVTSCNKDYVEIRNGYTRYAPLIGKYCGKHKPSNIKSTNGALWVKFVVSGESRNKVIMRYEFIPTHLSYHEVVSNKGICGLRHSEGKPSGGQRNWAGQWPWQAALTHNDQPYPQCGGALIANQWILTAANCFKRLHTSPYWTAHLGLLDPNHKDGNEQDLNVQAIYIHPQYDPNAQQNDIALVYLNRPVVFNHRVSPICLGAFTDLNPGQVCSIAKWGNSPNTNDTLRKLAYMDLTVLPNRHCNNNCIHGGHHLDSRMICADFNQGKFDSCHGDAGSPLMCQDAYNKWIVSGVSSLREQDCRTYASYTNVASHKDWIERVISHLSLSG